MTEEETKHYHQLQHQFLDKLLEQLSQRDTAGITWKYLSKRTRSPIVILQHQHPSHTAYLKIVEVAVQEGTSSVPSARFHLESVNPPEIFVSADFAEIVNSILVWRDRFMTKSKPTSSPIGNAELTWLGAIAKARLEAKGHADSLVVLENTDLNTTTPKLSTEMAKGILWNFPRDDDGRLPLNASVILTPYGPRPHTDMNRCNWIAAVSPEKRRSPQVITIGLRSLIAENHPYRWDTMPWLVNPNLPDDKLWAMPTLSYDSLGTIHRDQNIARLRQQCAADKSLQADRIALCILLQDAGQFGEAFSLFGTEIDESIADILHGQPPHPAYRDLMPSWTNTLRRALWECAPWHFEQIIATIPQKGRKPVKFRLLGLPGQPQQSKCSLMLTGNPKAAQKPRLELESTASNRRYPEVFWKRPIDIDLQRFGLIPGTTTL